MFFEMPLPAPHYVIGAVLTHRLYSLVLYVIGSSPCNLPHLLEEIMTVFFLRAQLPYLTPLCLVFGIDFFHFLTSKYMSY